MASLVDGVTKANVSCLRGEVYDYANAIQTDSEMSGISSLVHEVEGIEISTGPSEGAWARCLLKVESATPKCWCVGIFCTANAVRQAEW